MIPWLSYLFGDLSKPALVMTTLAERGFYNVGVFSSCVALGFKLWHKNPYLPCFGSGKACVVEPLTCGIQVWSTGCLARGIEGEVGLELCNALILTLFIGRVVESVSLYFPACRICTSPVIGSVYGGRMVCCGLIGQLLTSCRRAVFGVGLLLDSCEL